MSHDVVGRKQKPQNLMTEQRMQVQERAVCGAGDLRVAHETTFFLS